MLNSNKHTNKI